MDEEIVAKINSWKRFSNSKIWGEIVDMLKTKIEESDLIVNAIGADRELEFTKRDLAILNKQAYNHMINIPQEQIENLNPTKDGGAEELDAYAVDGEIN